MSGRSRNARDFLRNGLQVGIHVTVIPPPGQRIALVGVQPWTIHIATHLRKKNIAGSESGHRRGAVVVEVDERGDRASNIAVRITRYSCPLFVLLHTLIL